MKPKFAYFSIISSFFVAMLLISNIVATKLISLGPFIFTGGIIVFPITYIFSDILTEVYGYARSRKIIWTGFFSLILMSIILWIVNILPPAPAWPNQDAYTTILGTIPKIVVASIIGYWAGEFANSYVLAKLKILTKGKYLWMRTIGSTIVGEGIDTLLCVLIGFAGTIPLKVLIIAVFSSYIFKVLYEILATPATYKIVSFLKKKEHCDAVDKRTNFNPFKMN